MNEAHIAGMLGCNPNQPATWPKNIIDRLIRIEKREGKAAFVQELRKVLYPPDRPNDK